MKQFYLRNYLSLTKTMWRCHTLWDIFQNFNCEDCLYTFDVLILIWNYKTSLRNWKFLFFLIIELWIMLLNFWPYGSSKQELKFKISIVFFQSRCYKITILIIIKKFFISNRLFQYMPCCFFFCKLINTYFRMFSWSAFLVYSLFHCLNLYFQKFISTFQLIFVFMNLSMTTLIFFNVKLCYAFSYLFDVLSIFWKHSK